MELNTFMRELEASLVKRGFSEETAREQVAKITRKFTPQDLEEIGNIRSTEGIEPLADGIASILNQKRAEVSGQNARKPDPAQTAQRQGAAPDAPAAPVASVDPTAAADPGLSVDPAVPAEPIPRPVQPAAGRNPIPHQNPALNQHPAEIPPEQQRPRPAQFPAQPEQRRPRQPQPQNPADESYDQQMAFPVPARPAQLEQQRPRQQAENGIRQSTRAQQRPARQEPEMTGGRRGREIDENDYFIYSAESTPSTKGLLIFWVGLFVTLPITLALLLAIYGVFVVLFVALAALIIAGIAVLIAVVAAGAVISLVSIVFGITQLFTFVAGGLYEIGLGIMVAGAALFISILVYNFSLRFIPWVMSKLKTFVVFVSRKLKELFLVVRRRCYKL